MALDRVARNFDTIVVCEHSLSLAPSEGASPEFIKGHSIENRLYGFDGLRHTQEPGQVVRVLPEAFVGPLDPKPGECSGTPEFESTVYLGEVEHHPIRDLLHIAQVLGCPHQSYCKPVLTVITPLGVFAGAGRSTSVHMDEIVSLDPLYSVTAPHVVNLSDKSQSALDTTLQLWVLLCPKLS